MRVLRLLSTFSIAIALMTLPNIAQAASFNCSSKKLNYSERAICDNEYLSGLDSEMAQLYRQVLSNMGGQQQRRFVNSQNIWIRSRNGCRADISCLETVYERRIAYLRTLY